MTTVKEMNARIKAAAAYVARRQELRAEDLALRVEADALRREVAMLDNAIYEAMAKQNAAKLRLNAIVLHRAAIFTELEQDETDGEQ